MNKLILWGLISRHEANDMKDTGLSLLRDETVSPHWVNGSLDSVLILEQIISCIERSSDVHNKAFN
jgi:hypothetical protein